MAFSNEKAEAEFAAAFAVPARAVLTGEVTDATAAYKELGRLWASTQRELERLPPGEAHVPPADSTLAADVKDAVFGVLDDLWAEIKPKVSRDGVETRALGKRVSSVETAYAAAIRGAIAHAAAAADRAAAAPRPSLPVIHAMTPSAGPPTGAPASVHHAPPDAAPASDLVDVLLARMPGDHQTSGDSTTLPEPTKIPGNGDGATAWRAAAVPPSLARAAQRLVHVGTPPLRVERCGPAIAQNILQNSDACTFLGWVKDKQLSGGQLREALSIGRALDLAVHEMGPAYLCSTPAEVQLRRLLSVVLAAKTGSFKMAAVLEEIPTDGILAELPQSMVKDLLENMKLVSKMEGLLKT